MNLIEITPQFLADLKEKAQKVDKLCLADTDHIAAANPAVVLELIEKIERLEEEANWLAKQLTKFDVIPCPEHPCSRSGKNGCLQCWREAARKAVEEKESK